MAVARVAVAWENEVDALSSSINIGIRITLSSSNTVDGGNRAPLGAPKLL